MRLPASQRLVQDRRNRAVEIVCVVVVVAAFLALVAWFVLHHGGGVLNQG
jgi:hypothetical protein